MRKIFTSLAALVFVLSLSMTAVFAAPILTINCATFGSCTAYVDDSYMAAPPSDGSISAPYTTITAAVNKVKSSSTYNNIKIAGGTYDNETYPWTFNNPGKKIHIYGGYNAGFSTSDPKTYPVKIQTNGDSSVLDFTSTAGTISGLDISEANGDDILVKVSNSAATAYHVDIKNNVFHDNEENTIILGTTANGSNTANIEGNVFRNNQGGSNDGQLMIWGDVEVKNNLFYSNEGFSVLVCFDGAIFNNFIMGNSLTGTNAGVAYLAGNCDFSHNTITNNDVLGSGAMVLRLDNNGNMVRNNLITDNATIGGSEVFVHDAGDTSTVDYNVFMGNSGDPMPFDHNVSCDPMYANDSSTDPNNLKMASGSACVDAGTNLADVTVDYFGLARPADGNGDSTATSDPGASEAAGMAVTAPTISSLMATINPFSPNGDGTEDTTTLSFALNTNANVTVKVTDLGGATTYKVLMNAEAKSAGTVTAVWDGKETGGALLSDGNYRFEVLVSNGGGSDTKTLDIGLMASEEEPEETQETQEPGEDCAGFTDVDANDSDCDAIEYVKSIGAMTGNPDGTFAPNDELQRDQIAKIVLETFDKYVDGTDYCGGTAPFPDVMSSAWSYHYVCRGKDLGLITGYLSGEDAGFYRPARSVNRVEFLALLLRNLSEAMPSDNATSYNDVQTGQWYTGYAKYSKDHSLFTGSNLLVTQSTTRVEVADVIFKLHEQGKI